MPLKQGYLLIVEIIPLSNDKLNKIIIQSGSYRGLCNVVILNNILIEEIINFIEWYLAPGSV